jgi:ABC-2 type transport system ATP-binding protein
VSYILECKQLTKRYGGVEALSDVNLSLESGKIVGLLGPNGSGKTTLIKLCNGLLRPNGGEILIDGMAVGTETKKVVSYLPERTYLNPALRVQDIVAYFKDFYADFNEQRAFEMLNHLQISPKAKLKTLSKGTKEKVQLVLVMCRNAKLYFLDEPIAGVDPAARDMILRMVLSNYNPEATIVISTHLIADIEPVLDEFIFIQKGRCVMHDTVSGVHQREGKTVDQLFREVFAC